MVFIDSSMVFIEISDFHQFVCSMAVIDFLIVFKFSMCLNRFVYGVRFFRGVYPFFLIIDRFFHGVHRFLDGLHRCLGGCRLGEVFIVFSVAFIDFIRFLDAVQLVNNCEI